ncbi:MAG TPA: TlpA disulfide reductase family protein [Pyrinomonadaceae bacterium]|nr:TlpA disulfide reductase family protein [Pyrinomonadaceae bacterium]
MTRLTRTALLGALALALFSSLPARTNEASALSAQQSGEPRKATASPSTLVVRELDLAGLKKLLSSEGREGRPLLVNFWATWCEPCRAEFPDLVKIDNEYRNRGLDFVTVSIDEASEINTTVPGFLKEMRALMPAYLLNTPEQDAAIQFVDPRWTGSLPATFLFDAQGKIVFKHVGRIKPDELRSAIKAVVSDK